MTYPEAVQYLQRLQMFGAKLGLESTRALCERVGNPQQFLRFIHVAGTNGKGSVCAMLESIYRASGLRVGLYTSPHLVSFRERMQINRELIPEAEVVRLVTGMQNLLKPTTGVEHPTFFEVVTVMAMQYFKSQGCDLVIWETGLGGRLDATNVVTPIGSVITNVQLDHQQHLGDSIVRIAAEKAGIIKPGVRVITSAVDSEARGVIARTAKKLGSPCIQVDSKLDPGFELAMAGEHQRWNAALALGVVTALQPLVAVSVDEIALGLATVEWPGRFQRIKHKGCQFILDGAHNPDGLMALRQTVESQCLGKDLTLIFGALADKNLDAMCSQVAAIANKIILCPVRSKRTASTADLASIFDRVGFQGKLFQAKDLSDALARRGRATSVLITGSLYLIGEALVQLGHLPGGATSELALNEYSLTR